MSKVWVLLELDGEDTEMSRVVTVFAKKPTREELGKAMFSGDDWADYTAPDDLLDTGTTWDDDWVWTLTEHEVRG